MRIDPNGPQPPDVGYGCVWHILLFDLVRIQSHRARTYHQNVPEEPLLSHLALSALVCQLFSLLEPETSIMNFANHLSGFQDHQTQPWCTRAAQRFVTTWDFRKGTIHRDVNWDFLCQWIIWWSSVTLAALCAARRLLFDCLICLEKLKNRRDRALISKFSLYRLFYGNLLASLLLSATTCRFWKRR